MLSGDTGPTSESALGERFPSENLDFRAHGARPGSFPYTPFDGVSVWYVWHTGSVAYARIFDNLTAADFAEFAPIRNVATRRRSLAARALLRGALSETVRGEVKPREWVFERDAYGKPRLMYPFSNLHFSCSHTHLVSVVAVSRSHPVGIDIEAALPAEDDSSLIEEFFAAGEKMALQLVPSEERPHSRARLWSLKEAVVKMLGMGLALDVTKLEFDTEADHLKSSQAPEINVSRLRLQTWSIPNKAQSLSIALAVKN